jgi:hypothetical protein
MVGNQVRFSDEPLTWQYANYPGCVQTFLDALDGRFPGAEAYITEYNHLWLEDELFPQNPTINVHKGPYRTLLKNARRWGSLNLLRRFTVPRWGRPEQVRASRAPEGTLSLRKGIFQQSLRDLGPHW